MKSTLNENGVSLIETVSSIAVLSFGILSLMLLYTSGVRGAATARIITIQTNQAARQIEEIMALTYSDPALDAGPNDFLQDSDGDGRLGDEVGACGPNNTPPSGVDHCRTSQSGDIFYNVIEDQPIRHTKHIQILVKTEGNTRNEIVMEYVKPFHP